MKQPKALLLLSSVQMCKYFSHYGMRALLVLYLVEKLHFSDAHAFGINAIFISLLELGGIFGGILADRYLGLRRAFMLGASLLAIGYVSLFFEKGLFFSLGTIVLGTGLYRSNLPALLGETYQENDPRRKKGFTFLYMMQNLGALVSTTLCGFVAVQFGFRAGFALAAGGMVIGYVILWIKRELISGLGEALRKPKSNFFLLPGFILLAAVAFILAKEEIMMPLLPLLTVGVFLFFAVKLLRDPDLPQQKVRLLLVYLGAKILFFAAEDQLFSSLMVFAEREGNRTLFGWTIPVGMMLSLNPIVILCLGSVVGKLRIRLIVPFIMVAIAFGCLPFLSFFGVIVMISAAELMIAPLTYSFASEVATKGKAGRVVGMVPIASSLASLLGGGMSKWIAHHERGYAAGFIQFAIMILVGGVLLEILRYRFSHKTSAVVSKIR